MMINKQTYCAILFAPDGHFVKDFSKNQIIDVWKEIDNLGSKWIFFPICFVATSISIVDTPEGLEHLKRKRITTIKKLLASTDQEKLCRYINNGWPLADLF